MNAGNVLIQSLGVALPTTFTSARSLVSNCRKPIDFDMEAVTGIAETPTLPEGQYAFDLAERAVADCLIRSHRSRHDVELVVGCSLVNHNAPGTIDLEPSIALRIKRSFGLVNALTFDVSSACAGLFVGLRVAEAFLRSGAVKTVLLFAGEHVTHAAVAAQALIESASDPRMPCLTVGDSGAALLLEVGSNPKWGLLDFQLFTLGRYSGHCVAKPTPAAPGGIVMTTDSVRLAVITAREGMIHFERARRDHSPCAEPFDFMVPHQASAATLAGVMREANRRLGPNTLTEQNTLINLVHRGNTVTTTHFIAIHDAIQAGRIQNDQRLVLSTVASGATIGSAAYQLDDLPGRLRSRRPSRAFGTLEAGAEAETAWVRRLGHPVKIEALAVAPASDSEGKNSVTLGKAAARACFTASKIDRSELGVVVFAGVYKSEFVVEPAVAAFLTGELRINESSAASPKRTLAFDLNDGENGFLSACLVSAQLIEARKLDHALVIVAEADVAYRPGSPRVLPAAAAATLTRSEDGSGFKAFGCYTRSENALAITSAVVLLPTGGAELVRALQMPLEECYSVPVLRALELFRDACPELCEKLDFILLPHVQSALTRVLSDRLGLQPTCEILEADLGRDLLSSNLAASLALLYRTRAPFRGQRALLVSAGAGIKVVCALYEF